MSDPARKSRRPQVFTAVAATAAALVLAALVWRTRRHDPVVIPFEPFDTAEVWRDPLYVVDPDVGHRGRKNVLHEFTMGAFDGSAPERVVLRVGARGFVTVEDLPATLTVPPVVLLGDSHTAGVVNTADNVGPRLQALLRAEPGFADVAVLNAGTGYYSLYQYVLRARQLVAEYAPRAVVVVAFMGNDLHDLEDVERPHLDDALRERVPARDGSTPPPRLADTWQERKEKLALPARFKFLDNQGMYQLAYFHGNPDRVDVVLRKAQRSVSLMKELTDAHSTRLLFVLLPSFDLVFPGLTSECSEYARELVESGLQERLYDRFRATLDEAAVEYVDLLPTFRKHPALDLYATDFHIWKRGHAVLAREIAAALLDGH